MVLSFVSVEVVRFRTPLGIGPTEVASRTLPFRVPEASVPVFGRCLSLVMSLWSACCSLTSGGCQRLGARDSGSMVLSPMLLSSLLLCVVVVVVVVVSVVVCDVVVVKLWCWLYVKVVP